MGTITLYTEHGPFAAANLQPGDRVLSRGHGGTAILMDLHFEEYTGQMVRIAPGALGRARPDDFAIVPPDQRLLLRCAAGAPRDGVFTAGELIDGGAIRWHQPAEPVLLVHLVFDEPRIVHAGGLEIEVAC